MAKVLAVRTFNRLNNRLYANSNGYAIHNNKGDQVSSIAAIWAIYHHMIMGPPEESVESQHSYCPNGDNKNYPYVDFASYGSVSKIQTQNNHLCFQC